MKSSLVSLPIQRDSKGTGAEVQNLAGTARYCDGNSAGKIAAYRFRSLRVQLPAGLRERLHTAIMARCKKAC
jgi:hypothetical protein